MIDQNVRCASACRMTLDFEHFCWIIGYELRVTRQAEAYRTFWRQDRRRSDAGEETI